MSPYAWSIGCLLALASCKTQASIAMPDGGPAAVTATPSAAAPDLPASVAADESLVPDVAPPLSERGAKALREDGEKRKGDLLLAIGDSPRGQFVEDTFYVLSTDPAAPYDAAVAQARAMVAALWHGRHFTYRLEHAIPIWVFKSTEDMGDAIRRYAPEGVPTNEIGVYSDGYREIFFATAPAGITTLNHEMCHPMLAQDLPPMGDAMLWVYEGFCALFEASDITPSGEMHFKPHMRIMTLQKDLRTPAVAGEVRLDKLLGMKDDVFTADEPLHYAMAREFFRFLWIRNQLWPWYHAYRRGIVKDPTGQKALEAVTGQTLAQVNDAWLAWAKSPAALAP